MKAQRTKFAPFGLYLAGAALVAALVIFIIFQEFNLYVQISLGLAVVGLAAFALLDPARLRTMLTGRQARYGSNALVMVLAFVGIVIVVNYFVSQNPVRWDLTEAKDNTLAKETLDTLKALPDTVNAQAFFTPRIPSDQARSLLEQYRFNSSGKFEFAFIDPEADPLAAQSAQIKTDGSVVLRMGARSEVVSIVQEREMTAALVRLMAQESVGVYFLTGHGERNPGGSGDQSYAAVKTALEAKNYKVEPLNLLSQNTIPADARVIIIAGPTAPVSQEEVALLDVFMANGGALVVMEEPLPLTQFGGQPDPLAAYLDETWGITLGQDIVVDQSSQQIFVAVANSYANHPVTDRLSGLISFFPTARSVQVREIPGLTSSELVFTANQSWAETDLAALENQQLSPDPAADLIGPVPLAAAMENQGNRQRIVVFGDADFAIDANFGRYGNGDLLVNAVDWVSEQEQLLNLTPKEQIQRVIVPPQRYTMGLIFFVSVVLMPGLVLVAGVVVYIQRRRRG